MKIQINVTKEILEKSKMCNSKMVIGENCAIALAIRDIFPKTYVGNGTIFIGANIFEADQIDLPRNVSKFIVRFDKASAEERILMKEFSFEIDVPEKLINQIGINQVKEILEKSSTLQLVEL